MKQAVWRMVSLLSRSLDPDERDAVLGDIVESGGSAWKALADVMGLIARRQAAPWKSWRPWAGLFGLALPVGFYVGGGVFSLERSCELYLWLARNHWTFDPAITAQTGLTLSAAVARFGADALLLTSQAWMSGLVLGVISRSAIGINGVVLCLVAVAVSVTSVLWAHPYSIDGLVLARSFYAGVPWAVLLTAFAVVPAVRGMRRDAFPSAPWTLLCCAAAVGVLTVKFRWLPAAGTWRPAIGLLVAYWPIAYMTIMAVLKERGRNDRVDL